jgi:hypothetical protein
MKEKVSIGKKILGYFLGALGFFIANMVFMQISPALLGFEKIGGGFIVAMLFALLSIWIIWKSSKIAQSSGTIIVWSAVLSFSYFGQHTGMKYIAAKKVGPEAQYFTKLADLYTGAGVALILLILTVFGVAIWTARKEKVVQENVE